MKRSRSKLWAELRPTQRRARTGKNKGKRFEILVAEKLQEKFGGRMLAREMGQAGSDVIDTEFRLPWGYTEAKHHRTYPSLNSLAELMTETKGTQVAFVKANHKPVLVVLSLETFLNLVPGGES